MTTIVLLSNDATLVNQLQVAFQRQAPDLTVVRADHPAAAQAQVAACWFPPPGSLAALPNLQLVHSVAAGVDHLSNDPGCPDLPVCRVVDPAHRQGMTEYVRWAVLHFHRGFDRVTAQQRSATWQRPPQRPAADYTIGVMGLGSLGAAIAQDLASAGYSVRGWARSAKALPSVQCLYGAEQFPAFLQGVDLLVNLLPLTASTRGILGADTFGQLVPGAVVVNCGRGQHVQLNDLRQALDSGQLRGAVLDVFEREPLAEDDPLWQQPGLIITPHMASAASHDCIASQVADNARRLARGEPLNNPVDKSLGY